MQKGQIVIWIIVGALVVATIAGGAYIFGRSTSPKSSPTPTVISQTPQPTSTPNASPALTGAGEISNWKTYTFKNPSIQYSYVINHPSQATIKEEIKGYSGKTILSINGGLMEILVNLDLQGEVDPVRTEPFKIANTDTTKFYLNETNIIIKAIPFPDEKNTVLFQITLPQDRQKANELEEIFDQILFTFKFL